MSRLINIGTIKGDGENIFTVERMVGKEELSRLFEYRLDLLSEDPGHTAEQFLGTNASVRIEMPGGAAPRYLNGYISRFSVLGQVKTPAFKASTGYRYQLTLSPWLWFLTRTSTCAIFQDKTMLQVIEAVLERHGALKSLETKVAATTETREYCVQYRETDFNFVSRLMEQAGIYYYFTHENAKHTLVLTDDPSSHVVMPGRPELYFSSNSLHAASLKTWALNAEVQPGAYAIDDYDYNKANTALLKVSSKERTHKNAGFELYDYPGEYLEPSWGETYAKVRMEELYCQYELSRGAGTERGVCVGHKFKLADHPVAALNKEYLVVSHSFSADNNLANTGGGSGALFESSFTVIPATTQFRPPRLTPLPSIAGPQTATVVGPAGEEIHTDALGRVRLQFHWDRYSTGSDKDSIFVRVSNPFAGKQWGSINIPRVGQEVIVQFLEGDPDRPLVTGRVYNSENQTPYDMPAKKMYTGFKTRSYPDGATDQFHELRFDDTKGSEQIYLQSQKWMDFRVKSNFKEYVGGTYNSFSAGRMLVQSGEEMHHTAKGDLRLTSETGFIDLGAKDDIAIVSEDCIFLDGVGQITLKSPLIALDADDINLKGKKIYITGSDFIDLKCGGSFVSIKPDGVYIKGPMVYVNSGGSAEAAEGVPATTHDAPKKPAIAMNSVGGYKSPPPAARTKPKQYSGQATAFKVAAKGGSPFVTPCDGC
jgi:type VI secretion system secreted protein VgrG